MRSSSVQKFSKGFRQNEVFGRSLRFGGWQFGAKCLEKFGPNFLVEIQGKLHDKVLHGDPPKAKMPRNMSEIFSSHDVLSLYRFQVAKGFSHDRRWLPMLSLLCHLRLKYSKQLRIEE